MSEFECWTKLYGHYWGEDAIWMEYGNGHRAVYKPEATHADREE